MYEKVQQGSKASSKAGINKPAAERPGRDANHNKDDEYVYPERPRSTSPPDMGTQENTTNKLGSWRLDSPGIPPVPEAGEFTLTQETFTDDPLAENPTER